MDGTPVARPQDPETADGIVAVRKSAGPCQLQTNALQQLTHAGWPDGSRHRLPVRHPSSVMGGETWDLPPLEVSHQNVGGRFGKMCVCLVRRPADVRC
jgi:hypothetical protein